MAAADGTVRSWSLHPLHAVFLLGAIPLFLGALLSDIAYWCSYQVQWINFASWLILGGLAFAVVALVFAVAGSLLPRRRGMAAWHYPGVLAATCLLGLVNALVHAGDAWASMPAGLVLSAILVVLIGTATGLAYARSRTGGTP